MADGDDILLAAGRAKAQGTPPPAVAPRDLPTPMAPSTRDKLPAGAPYPKDFVKLYNKAVDTYQGLTPKEKASGADFWATHLQALDQQKAVYDVVNKQGLNNLPEKTQQYIATHPSFEEWKPQGPPKDIAAGEPYSPTPQIDDIRRLFQNRILGNEPTGAPGMDPQLLRGLMRAPGFAGFTGGQGI